MKNVLYLDPGILSQTIFRLLTIYPWSIGKTIHEKGLFATKYLGQGIEDVSQHSYVNSTYLEVSPHNVESNHSLHCNNGTFVSMKINTRHLHI